MYNDKQYSHMTYVNTRCIINKKVDNLVSSGQCVYFYKFYVSINTVLTDFPKYKYNLLLISQSVILVALGCRHLICFIGSRFRVKAFML